MQDAINGGSMTSSATQTAAGAAGGHIRTLAAIATVALCAIGLLAGVASAKSRTLHFYQVSGPTQFYNAAGQPINVNPPATLPKPGDSFDETDLDYSGTARHHASHWTASDHLTCTFTNADTGACNFQIAISGSLLLSNNFTLHFATPEAVAPISEGTGAFHGVHGRLTDVNLPKSSNASILTIYLS
jgi:hypothetical protein